MTPASVFSRFSAARRAWSPATAAAAALLLSAAGLRAQYGALHTSFNAGSIGSTVYAIDYVAYGDFKGNPFVKVTVGGDKTLGSYYLNDPTLNDTQGNPAPLLQPNGAANATFLFPLFGNAARIIFTIVPERNNVPDTDLPNLLLGGSFDGGFGRSTNNNKPAQNIVRITPSGLLDTGFSSGLGVGANGYVTSLLPLLDGRIVVGGLFTAVSHQPRRRVARLQNDGTVDPNFATGANIDNDVLALAEGIEMDSNGTPDTNTLVGGNFNHVAGQPYGKLVRLDPNGNLDMSFHPSIDLRVLAILVQADGKIVIGGDFTNVNGTKVSHLARLQYDGSLDPTFVGGVSGVPNNDVNPTAVNVLKPLGDATGRIYVGGEFAQINGTARKYLGLISADGVLDTTFDPQNAVYNAVQSLAIQSDSNVLVGETAGPRINSKFPPSLVRLIGAPKQTGTTDLVPAAKTAPSSVQATTTAPAAASKKRVSVAPAATSGALEQ